MFVEWFLVDLVSTVAKCLAKINYKIFDYFAKKFAFLASFQ